MLTRQKFSAGGGGGEGERNKKANTTDIVDIGEPLPTLGWYDRRSKELDIFKNYRYFSENLFVHTRQRIPYQQLKTRLNNPDVNNEDDNNSNNNNNNNNDGR